MNYISNKYTPKNNIEVTLTSLIFSLEIDMRKTRFILNETQHINLVEKLIDDQLYNLDKLQNHLDVDVSHIDSRLLPELKNLRSQYKKLLLLFKEN